MENAINVAKYIISQTPIGHLNKSIQNLKSLIGEETMESETINKELEQYAENHLTHVQYNDEGKKIVISNLNKDNNGFYIDQGQQIKIKLNITGGEIQEKEKYEETNKLRNEIDSKVKE